jgi:hypothetical protein
MRDGLSPRAVPSGLDRILRLVFVLAALADLVIAGVVVPAPTFLFHIARVPVPADLLYVRLAALLAGGCGGTFLVAVGRTSPWPEVIAAAAAIRLATAALFILSVRRSNAPAPFAWLGGLEAALGASHAWFAHRLLTRNRALAGGAAAG